jgi:hypothetical protein
MLEEPQKSSAFGIVLNTSLSQDRSVLRATVSLWPDEIEIVCRVAWDACGPDAGIFQFPQQNDLVLVEYPELDEDSPLITKRLSSAEDTIPVTATDGSLVLRSLSGKKNWLTSDTRVNISRGDAEPTENLIIGQKFKTVYTTHLNELITLIEKLVIQRETDANHTHIGVFGVPVNIPIQSAVMLAEKAELETIKANLESLLADEVESEAILSDFAFTEK